MPTVRFTTPQQNPPTFSVEIETKEHNKLNNRNAENCHPISAITGLQQALDNAGQVKDVEVDGQSVVNQNGVAEIDLTGKQDVIDDLSQIRAGASLGATAVQPSDVGDAKLTIQKNGTAIDTFTANATSDKTINITVPTQASDVNALPDSTKYGSSLTLSINSSTYVVTAQLKDQNGNNLGSAQTIDLPLESVVVSGSYDAVNKKIVLTLQNGNTIDVPVGDLVAGLQTEITAQNKLSADLVDDTYTTNKFVTASDKTTWNGKQDAISDLETIRSGASAGATALQPNTAITGATKCKITYDSKGLVTAGADLSSSDITTALGYTPYDSSNPNGYTSNTGTVTSVNNVSPVSGNVTLSIPTVNNPTITLTQGGVTKGSFTLNQSSGETIDLDAGGGSDVTLEDIAEAGTNITFTHNTYTPDYTVVGSPTISSDYVLSNISSGNYVYIASPISSGTNFEIVFKVRTPATIPSTDYPVFSFSTGGVGSGKDVFLEGSTKKFCQWDGSHKVSGTSTIQPDTDYIVKLTYDGSNYKLYVNEILEYTTSYAIASSGNMYVGVFGSDQFWLGSVYLKDCYIKSNGEYLWRACTPFGKTTINSDIEGFTANEVNTIWESVV